MALAHEKVGHTGQGLWHHKGMQLPAFFQHVANDLIQSGHSESDAIQMAIGVCEKWARGGGGVTPETQAKAAAAVAEWEKLRARAKAGAPAKRAAMSDGEYDSDGLHSSWDDPSGLPDLSGLDVSHFEAAESASGRASGLRSGRNRLS